MSKSNSKRQPVVAINDETGEIKEFTSINKAAKFIGASLAHVARCLVKDKKYKGKGYIIKRISE